MTTRPAIGMMFIRSWAPEALVPTSRQAESGGLDELWVIEDTCFTAGFSQAATALAVTDRLTVGLGIVPAVVRSPVITAMEIATLARIHPGRFLPGIGHGVAEWMDQLGLRPPSWLAAIEETTTAVRGLLAGDEVSVDGRTVHLDHVQLDTPPARVPPVSLGVQGEKSLALSGRVADGTILTEYSSPDYVRWAREQILAGAAEAGRSGDDHRLTVYLWADVDRDDPARARDGLRRQIAEGLASGAFRVQTSAVALPFHADLAELTQDADAASIERGLRDDWLDHFAAAGTPEQVAAAIDRIAAAGADAVVLVAPTPSDPAAWLGRVTEQLLPILL
ncbi:MAG TPA: LLM class flavin-dependent oxidoreductase [Thermomicrobiales bacterium]|jgi:alkanesulfonate monooxygenase SsuD/methylene tetrahydromethanopterin reductase-like flavin-dependent oxidoreductase (luciferase family)|nr:LLM class flavin-dependent oxidoreductase [Thermomicrobiales bacterium]